MTHKEIADELRSIEADNFQNAAERIINLADELDPPRPEPGEIVWFRDIKRVTGWFLGRVSILGDIQLFGSTRDISFDDVEYVPADIIAPDHDGIIRAE